MQREAKVLFAINLVISAYIIGWSIVFENYLITLLIVVYLFVQARLVSLASRQVFDTMSNALMDWASTGKDDSLTIEMDDVTMTFSKVSFVDSIPTISLPNTELEEPNDGNNGH